MPQIKSAKKRVLVTEKLTLRNKSIKSALKTEIKKYDAAVAEGNKEVAAELLKESVSKFDKAACKGTIHKNKANRKKAQLAKKLNSISE